MTPSPKSFHEMPSTSQVGALLSINISRLVGLSLKVLIEIKQSAFKMINCIIKTFTSEAKSLL